MILVANEDLEDIHIKVTTIINVNVVIRYKDQITHPLDEVIERVTNIHWKPKKDKVFIQVGNELCKREVKISDIYWLSFDKTTKNHEAK